jgi:hypothetical protein
MSAALWLADGAIAVGDLWLTAVCIRQQVILGGVTGITGLALLAFATSRGVSGDAAHAALGFALVFLIVGGALVGLGGGLQHLLDDPPDSQDASHCHGRRSTLVMPRGGRTACCSSVVRTRQRAAGWG